MMFLAETIQVDVQLLTFGAGFVVPLLVGVLSRAKAPQGVKVALNLGLSTVAGALATAIEAEGVISPSDWATGIVMTWLVSTVSYYGLWKPSGVEPAIQRGTRSFGAGVPKIVTSEGPPRRRNRPLRADRR